MQEEKHIAAVQEVLATIQDALEAREGIIPHQRRLMAMLSIGVSHIFELYAHRKGIIKPGAQIKHEWFLLSEQRLIERLNQVFTKPHHSIPGLSEMCDFGRSIETGRNDLVYGAPLSNDKPLRTKIGQFLELKNLVEQESGVIQHEF